MTKIMKFGDMVDGLLHFYQTTINRKKNKLWEYNGPELTSNCILSTSPTIKEQFSKENFDWQINNHGKHPIEVLLNAAIQLGIQQGINMCSEKPSRYIECEKFDNLMDEMMVKFLKEDEK
jgi:hypothetical protein